MPPASSEVSAAASDPGPQRVLHALAVFELSKGALALAAVAAAGELVHWEHSHALDTLLARLPVSIEGHAARILLRAAGMVDGHRLGDLEMLASGYAALRAVEGIGLWLGRAWGQWIALISALSYLPWEIWGLWRHAGPVHLILLAGNLALVAYLAQRLIRSRRC